MAASVKTASVIADLINKVFVTIALLIGGGWAIYKFVLTESPSAQLELDQLKRLCAERGSLDIKIEASSALNVLHGTVVIKNIGTRGVDLHLEPATPPINVARIEFSPAAKLTMAESIAADFPFTYGDNKLVSWSEISLLPGRTNNLHFVAPISHPGYYLVIFLGGKRQTAPDVASCKDVSVRDEPDLWWGAQAIFFVSDPASAVTAKSVPAPNFEGPIPNSAR